MKQLPTWRYLAKMADSRTLHRLLGRLDRIRPRRAHARVGLPACFRPTGAGDADLQSSAVCPLVGDVGRDHGGAARLVGGALSARRSNLAVARRRGVPRGRQTRDARRRAPRSPGLDRLQLHPSCDRHRQSRRPCLRPAAARHTPRRRDVRPRIPVSGRRHPVHRLQEGRRCAHLLASLFRCLLRSRARRPRGIDGVAGDRSRYPPFLPIRRVPFAARSPLRIGLVPFRRDGSRWGRVALGLAPDGRPLRRQRHAHPEPRRPPLRAIEQVILPRTTRGSSIDAHPSVGWGWEFLWKYQGTAERLRPSPVLGAPDAGAVTRSGSPARSGLTADEQRKVAAMAHVRVTGDASIVEPARVRGATIDAYAVDEREPNAVEWFLSGEPGPMRSIGSNPEPDEDVGVADAPGAAGVGRRLVRPRGAQRSERDARARARARRDADLRTTRRSPAATATEAQQYRSRIRASAR